MSWHHQSLISTLLQLPTFISSLQSSLLPIPSSLSTLNLHTFSIIAFHTHTSLINCNFHTFPNFHNYQLSPIHLPNHHLSYPHFPNHQHSIPTLSQSSPFTSTPPPPHPIKCPIYRNLPLATPPLSPPASSLRSVFPCHLLYSPWQDADLMTWVFTAPNMTRPGYSHQSY